MRPVSTILSPLKYVCTIQISAFFPQIINNTFFFYQLMLADPSGVLLG